jgi:arylsulfatase
VVNGAKQKPLDGMSFLKCMTEKDTAEIRKTQYFELGTNRAIYHDGCVAASRFSAPWLPTNTAETPLDSGWELYHIEKDFSQANDLAARRPEKLNELEDIFWKEAEKNNVLPLDWRTIERLNSAKEQRCPLGQRQESR